MQNVGPANRRGQRDAMRELLRSALDAASPDPLGEGFKRDQYSGRRPVPSRQNLRETQGDSYGASRPALFQARQGAPKTAVTN